MTMVMNQQPSRRERSKAAIRARIIAAAIKLFSQRGLSEVTVDEIAEAADVGKGTIYNYFAAKEDIVVAFMVDQEARVQQRVPHFAESTEPLHTILARFIRFQFRIRRPYHPFMRVFLAQMFQRTEHFMPYMAEMQKSFDPPLELLFRRLRERHIIRTDVEIPDLILAFKTVHMGLTALWAVEGPPFRQTTRLLKQEMLLFSEGLGRRR
jgi:AcrR family transcriptional regulator